MARVRVRPVPPKMFPSTKPGIRGIPEQPSRAPKQDVRQVPPPYLAQPWDNSGKGGFTPEFGIGGQANRGRPNANYSRTNKVNINSKPPFSKFLETDTVAVGGQEYQTIPFPPKRPRGLKGHVDPFFIDPPKDTFLAPVEDGLGQTGQRKISAIDYFKSSGGFAIANHYAIRIGIPDKLRQFDHVHGPVANNQWLRDIELRAEAVSMPGRNLNTTTDSNIYGPTREIVNGAGYSGDMDVSFYADHELGERVFFENWQELAFGNPDKTNTLYGRNTWNAKYYKDYIGTLEIYVLNKNDEAEYGIKLHEVYPKTIGPTDLNHAPNGEIVKIPVTFAYRYWTNIAFDVQYPKDDGS